MRRNIHFTQHALAAFVLVTLLTIPFYTMNNKGKLSLSGQQTLADGGGRIPTQPLSQNLDGGGRIPTGFTIADGGGRIPTQPPSTNLDGGGRIPTQPVSVDV
jgi:hypothetical protein